MGFAVRGGVFGKDASAVAGVAALVDGGIGVERFEVFAVFVYADAVVVARDGREVADDDDVVAVVGFAHEG